MLITKYFSWERKLLKWKAMIFGKFLHPRTQDKTEACSPSLKSIRHKSFDFFKWLCYSFFGEKNFVSVFGAHHLPPPGSTYNSKLQQIYYKSNKTNRILYKINIPSSLQIENLTKWRMTVTQKFALYIYKDLGNTKFFQVSSYL